MEISQSTNDQLMIMAAHRYCLGRRSYIVPSCIEFLQEHCNMLKDNTQNVIIRDTIDEIMDNRAGDDIDKRGWWAFANAKFNLASQESKEYILSQIKGHAEIFDEFKNMY